MKIRKGIALGITALTIAAAGTSVTAQAAARKYEKTISDNKTVNTAVLGGAAGLGGGSLKDILEGMNLQGKRFKWGAVIWGTWCPVIPEIPEKPEIPDNPGDTEKPDNPGNPDSPGDTEKPEKPETPDNPGDTEGPEKPETPDSPGDTEKPEKPETPDNPGDAEKPDNPGEPDSPEAPDNPTVPDKPVEPETPGGGTDENVPDEDTTFAGQVIRLVNAERAKEGLSPLKLDKGLESAAMVRTQEIQSSFSHTRPDGRSFITAITEAGVSYRRAGENIAWGQKTPEEVVDGWMNSPSHRANIMNAAYGRIGVGHIRNSRGVSYWVQLFAD